MKKREKMTILLVSKNQKAVKPKQISGNVVMNWKKYVAFFVFIIFSLSAVIGYLMMESKNHEATQLSLRNKIQNLKTTFEDIDTTAIKQKFNNIDRELETINSYMKARGIKQTIKMPQGGEENDIYVSAEETGDFYESYLKKISYNFSHIPLGYPYFGTITSTFGHRENPFGGKAVETHSGLDIRAPMGAPVKATAKGTVVFAGRKGGYGNCIIIRHLGSYETLYGHLSQILVSPGQQIDIGQQIGKVGSTGRSTGPHLHYEVHKDGKRINPKSFLTLN
jgi:murein DD-endopeptidase MepM/ murein hydrolase activator NlpD